MCVCVHLYVHIYACIHVYACVSVHVCASLCVCMHVFTLVPMCVYKGGLGVEGRATHWVFLFRSMTQWLREGPQAHILEPGNR